MVEIAAHDRGLFPVPARSDPEQEAAAAEEVERRDLLGQEQGIPLRHQGDPRSELEPRRHARGPGERGQRAGAVMRGDVLIDAQVEAGHRACLRQQAEKQDQDTERRAGQQHGQAMPRYP